MIVSFGLLIWATEATYRLAPPQPERIVAADGTVLMTGDDIVAGKAGFQRADLKDQRKKVQEEAAIAQGMLPQRHLVRPLLVIVPEEN